MVVYDANSLQESVYYCRTNKPESPFFQVLADNVGKWRRCGNFVEGLPTVLDGFPVGETPEISVKAAELFLYRHDTGCIIDYGADF